MGMRAAVGGERRLRACGDADQVEEALEAALFQSDPERASGDAEREPRDESPEDQLRVFHDVLLLLPDRHSRDIRREVRSVVQRHKVNRESAIAGFSALIAKYPRAI